MSILNYRKSLALTSPDNFASTASGVVHESRSNVSGVILTCSTAPHTIGLSLWADQSMEISSSGKKLVHHHYNGQQKRPAAQPHSQRRTMDVDDEWRGVGRCRGIVGDERRRERMTLAARALVPSAEVDWQRQSDSGLVAAEQWSEEEREIRRGSGAQDGGAVAGWRRRAE
uniref:Uncharacterized protein n=1 Tax=Oryza barthii TaxID=65489 RepID=A0A0D3FZG5_9ORYZ